MTNYLFEKLHPDEERINKLYKILKQHNLTADYDDARTQPGLNTMRHLQIKCNQLMAPIATENKANSAEVVEMKKEFLLFLAYKDY